MKDAILTQLVSGTFTRVTDARNSLARYKLQGDETHLAAAADTLRFALESLAAIERRIGELP